MAPSDATPPGPGNTNPYGFTQPATPAPPSALYTGGTSESAAGGAAESAPVFTVPAAYGQSAQTLVAGQGRLARPRFATTGSMSVGYDDNVLSTPYNALGMNKVTAEQETAPAIPAHFVRCPRRRSMGARRRPTASAPWWRWCRRCPRNSRPWWCNPRSPPAKPIGSFAVRANVNGEVQFSNRRTVFTLDATIGDTYYASRPGSQNQYNGNVSLLYSHRITPRLAFSATANVAYLNQPNLQLVNAPTQGQGDYINANTKYNLSYRWTPRFSTVTSLSLDSQYFVTKNSSAGSFYDVDRRDGGALYSGAPRLTVLAEVRYCYDELPQLELHGPQFHRLLPPDRRRDHALPPAHRLRARRRADPQLPSGGTSASPYAETSLSYRYSRTGFVSWNTRLGFEEPQTATVYASRCCAARSMPARPSASARAARSALAGVHRITTDERGEHHGHRKFVSGRPRIGVYSHPALHAHCQL